MEELIRIEKRGRILIARIHNPPHQFMTGPMTAELGALVNIVNSNALCAQRATRHNIWYRVIRTRE